LAQAAALPATSPRARVAAGDARAAETAAAAMEAPILSKSASAPGLGSSLRVAGASNAGLGAAQSTNLYDKMRAEGKFREHWPNVKPAGRSIVSAVGDPQTRPNPLEPIEVPQTPVGLRKYRRTNMGPGEMHVHWGLKDQKLPSEGHRFGAPGVAGMTTESTMKAGALVGVAEYKNSVGERVYASTKRKPLGNTYSRGHEVSIPEKGFGKKEYDVADAENDPGKPRCPFPRELSPPSDQDKVVFTLVLGGVDSAALVADDRLLKKLEAQVRAAVCDRCGSELRISPKDVYLQPSHGEDGFAMKVQIDPPDGVSVESVASKFQDPTGLDEGICQGASSIRGMDKVSSGPLSLSSCSTPQVVRGAAAMYRKSHNTVKPGEQGKRDYVYPQAVHQPNFRFGGGKADAVSGAGAKLALNMAAADDGSVARTRLAQKAAEDYRHVKHPKPFQKMHYMQGPGGPPVAQDHVFGAKSGEDTTSVEVCIKGCYSLQEQLPDQDLGRCTKLGRRNVTTETRAFGVPSVRADIPGPSSKGRSLADAVNYGDECGAAALLGPQRFDERGVPDSEFLVRRPKEDIASLVQGLPEIDLEELWPKCLDLFDDDLELVSLDALLHVHSLKVGEEIAQRVGAFGGTGTSAAPARGSGLLLSRSASAAA